MIVNFGNLLQLKASVNKQLHTYMSKIVQVSVEASKDVSNNSLCNADVELPAPKVTSQTRKQSGDSIEWRKCHRRHHNSSLIIPR